MFWLVGGSRPLCWTWPTLPICSDNSPPFYHHSVILQQPTPSLYHHLFSLLYPFIISVHFSSSFFPTHRNPTESGDSHELPIRSGKSPAAKMFFMLEKLAGSKPVGDRLRTSFEPDSVMEFGREPASSCSFAASKLDDRPNFSSNQLRTSSEPAAVMAFGF